MTYIQSGKRPPLTDELEALGSLSKAATALSQSGGEPEDKEAELDSLEFLVNLFRQCTQENPTDRPSAEDLYEKLLSRMSNLTSKKN